MKKYFTFFLLLCFTFILQAQIPTNGLIAYYPFNGNGNDVSGNNLNGTINDASLTLDRFGNANSAYYFSHAMGGIVVSNFPVLDSIYTISVWVNLDKYTQNSSSRILSLDWTNSGEFVLYKDIVNPLVIWFDDKTSIGGIFADSLKYAFWYNIIAIRNNNLTKLYINGKECASESKTPIPVGSVKSLYIGGDPNQISGDASFNGYIDDIRIYNRALTNKEIISLVYENPDSIYYYNKGYTAGVKSVDTTAYINKGIESIDTLKIYNNGIAAGKATCNGTKSEILKTDKISVYPNPVSNGAISVDVYENITNIDVSDLAKGYYLIKIMDISGKSLKTVKLFISQ